MMDLTSTPMASVQVASQETVRTVERESDDPLRAMRGILVSALLGVAMWALIGLIVLAF